MDGETVVGIGVSIQATVSDGVQILSVLEGLPAQEAGLSAATASFRWTASPWSRAWTLLPHPGRGGTQTTLTVRLHSTGKTRDFTLERRAVVIPIVTYELKDGDVGYIKCDSFGASTAATVQEALEELEGRADVWIMDLRANPGGTDTAVNLTAGKFTNGIMVYMLSAGLAYYRGIRPDAPRLHRRAGGGPHQPLERQRRGRCSPPPPGTTASASPWASGPLRQGVAQLVLDGKTPGPV